MTEARLNLLRARVDLADSIVVAARTELHRVAALPMSVPNRSLYLGCKAAYQQRCRMALDLHAELVAANLVTASA